MLTSSLTGRRAIREFGGHKAWPVAKEGRWSKPRSTGCAVRSVSDPSRPGGYCGAADRCTCRRAAAGWDRGHGDAPSCRRVGGCCGPSGCAATWPRSTRSSPAGVADTATRRSWPTNSLAVTSAMPIPRWRSARSAAGPSTGPTAPPRRWFLRNQFRATDTVATRVGPSTQLVAELGGMLVGWRIATASRPVRGGRDVHRWPCCDRPSLVLQAEIVIFMAAGRLAGGSGRHERGLGGGVATKNA